MRILSYVLTFASSRMGTMALMGSLIFSPSASVPIAKSYNRKKVLFKDRRQHFILSFPEQAPLSPVLRGTACPPSPGSASCSPQRAAGEWSTGQDKSMSIKYLHEKRWEYLKRTLLSSFWYWGIFFNIWDRSLIVVWNTGNFKLHKNPQKTGQCSNLRQ